MQDESDQEAVGGIKMSEWISVNTNGRYAVNRAGEVKNLEALCELSYLVGGIPGMIVVRDFGLEEGADND